MSDGGVIMITGASSGIGSATARRAVEAGWRVALGARSGDKLAELVQELGDDVALARRCDVTELSDQEALVNATLERFGRLDAVFANAGFGAKRGFLEESEEHWRSMVLTNVLGVAFSIRATLTHLLDADRGHYLLTGSIAGRRALPGSLYSSTKWAITGMAESLRQELRQMHENHTVRVTLIEPGMVNTPFFDDRPTGALEADDIARAALYALSEPPHVDVNELLVRPAAQSS